MPLLKQCRNQGCRKLIRDDINIYCEYHKEKYDNDQKERYKEYQARRNKDKNKKKLQDFYSSKDWKRLREVIKSECYFIDIFEFYRTGKIIEGKVVHHILEVEECWESRLDVNNLIYLTERNHKRIHEKYNQDPKTKKRIQKILISLLDRFDTEYKAY